MMAGSVHSKRKEIAMTTPMPPEPTPSAVPPQTPAPRKRGRWWKILLAVVVLLIVLILLAPTILSTGMGKNIVLGQINRRVPGKVTADSLSLGWFSGASVKNLEMKNDQGTSVVSLEAVDTPITLWNVLTGATVDLKGVSVKGAKTPQLPGSHVDIQLVGTADLGKKILNITGDSTITAMEDATRRSSVITILAGSKLSYGGEANDATIRAKYILEQFEKIFALPEGTTVAGERTVTLHITGALTKDAKLRAFRGINIDETSVGWDKVDDSKQGVSLGKADVKFHMAGGVLTLTPTNVPSNNGSLLVTGKVDFNADPPAYIIEKRAPGQEVVKSFGLNKEITAGWLKWLPLNWGNKEGQLMAVGGQADIRISEAYIPLDGSTNKITVVGTLSVNNVTSEAPFLAEVAKNLGPVLKMTSPDLLTIRGGTIPDVPFTVRDGKVSYTNLRLGTEKASLTFSGTVGLDNSLAMNMEVTARQLKLPIPVGLKGTIQHPELTITGLPGLGGNPEDIGKTLQKEGPNILKDLLNKKKK
jgi:autotransporter translocation and assembly factor TamB